MTSLIEQNFVQIEHGKLFREPKMLVHLRRGDLTNIWKIFCEKKRNDPILKFVIN